MMTWLEFTFQNFTHFVGMVILINSIGWPLAAAISGLRR